MCDDFPATGVAECEKEDWIVVSFGGFGFGCYCCRACWWWFGACYRIVRGESRVEGPCFEEIVFFLCVFKYLLSLVEIFGYLLVERDFSTFSSKLAVTSAAFMHSCATVSRGLLL